MTAIDNLSEPAMDTEVAEPAVAAEKFLTYIRPVRVGEGTGYAVCSEEGAQLAIFASYEAAFYSARQHNLTPVSVH